jgi:hypothetical protein
MCNSQTERAASKRDVQDCTAGKICCDRTQGEEMGWVLADELKGFAMREDMLYDECTLPNMPSLFEILRVSQNQRVNDSRSGVVRLID